MKLPHAGEKLDAWRSARSAAGAMLVGMDFDGTLAPIVGHADDARLPDATAQVLVRLAARADTRVAVISGRALADIEARIGVRGLHYAGNHGFELRGPDLERVHEEARAARPALERVAAQLDRTLRDTAGAWVEDKRYTLAVHYREVMEPRAEHKVRSRVTAIVEPFRELRVTEGRKVIEVRPAVEWDKGRALAWLMARLELPADAPCIFIGDDQTDEDAFRVVVDTGGGVLVAGSPRETAALAYVRSPEEVAALLEQLAS